MHFYTPNLALHVVTMPFRWGTEGGIYALPFLSLDVIVLDCFDQKFIAHSSEFELKSDENSNLDC